MLKNSKIRQNTFSQNCYRREKCEEFIGNPETRCRHQAIWKIMAKCPLSENLDKNLGISVVHGSFCNSLGMQLAEKYLQSFKHFFFLVEEILRKSKNGGIFSRLLENLDKLVEEIFLDFKKIVET